MATTPEWDHDEFFALFADAEVPEWSEPGDLSRFSIEAFTASVGWVDRASHGTIRMLGQGVTEHSVDLDAVGGVCQGFQRLVTNVAASRSGFRASRGRISQVVRQSTRLLLMASPAPGSVVLSLSSPVLPPQVEVPLPGTEAPSSVLDEAVLDVLDLMAAAREADGIEDDYAPRLKELGARAAASLGAIAGLTGAQGIDLELAWSPFGNPTRRASLSAGDARWLSAFVSSHNLDETEVLLTGTLRTISDMRALEIEVEPGETVSVLLGDQLPEGIEELRLHMVVTVRAIEKVKVSVSGDESRSYRLLGLMPVEVAD